MKISFIMPAYKARYLNEAIHSIVCQTSSDWELIIVDDNSPENLFDIVSKFDNPKISYHRNATNIGGHDLVAQWNHSITYATGEWIVMASDDDIYAPDFCSEVLDLAIKYPKVNLIRSRAETIHDDGRHIWSDIEFPEICSSYHFLHDWLDGKVMTCIGNYVFRRETLLGKGGFAKYPHAFCSDQETPIVMAENGVLNTEHVLFKFRRSELHLSGNKSLLKDKLTAMMDFYRWLERFEYPEPTDKQDIMLYSIKNKSYLHDKCIYDCFNHAIKLVSLKELPSCLQMCRIASFPEKTLMVARWIKTRICHRGHTSI